MIPDTRVNIGGISLKNPVLVASGTFGFGREYSELFDLDLLGGVVVKGTTYEARQGNPPPRIVETPSGMLNAIGLQNPGVKAVVEEALPFLGQFDTAVIVNVSGHSSDEYLRVAAYLTEANERSGRRLLDGLEVNISCPNVDEGGMAFGTDPEVAYDLAKRLRDVTDLPLIFKLTPNVTRVVEIASACQQGGADALSLINTLTGMVIDIDTQQPYLGNTIGGLSGPAVRPVALKMVWDVAAACDLPIIGMGGISTASDAVQFLLAGASAVAVGTALFRDPLAAVRVREGIEQYCLERGIASLRDLVGAANPGISVPEE